jgi:hypothetical protein
VIVGPKSFSNTGFVGGSGLLAGFFDGFELLEGGV